MSDISPQRRKFQIKKRQKRQRKLKDLRKRYSEAKTKAKKDRILRKVFKVAPYLTKERFLEPLEK